MNRKNLREGYRVEDAIADPELICFLPYIRTRRTLDMEVLRSWQRHFTVKDVPWVVMCARVATTGKHTSEQEIWELWKHGKEE